MTLRCSSVSILTSSHCATLVSWNSSTRTCLKRLLHRSRSVEVVAEQVHRLHQEVVEIERRPRARRSARRLVPVVLLEASALDFDDLLVQTVHLFRDHADAKQRWSGRFRHVLVDEFQDTNVAQWELVRMLPEEHRNVMVVGDQDQCLIAGTRITMGDGSHASPIEDVQAGDLVMSCYGSGDFRPAEVLRTHRGPSPRGVAIATAVRPPESSRPKTTCTSRDSSWDARRSST